MQSLPLCTTCCGLSHGKCQAKLCLRTISDLRPATHSHNRRRNLSNKRQKSIAGPAPLTRALELDIDLPEIDLDLGSFQEAQGVIVEAGIPVSFGNDAEALEALDGGVVIVDHKHWGRLRVAGEDRLNFLHGQSTGDFLAMKPGSGCFTVFVDRKGRTIDLAQCLIQANSVLLLVSPSRRKPLLTRLDQYIFYGDKVEVSDLSVQTVQLGLAGPGSDGLMESLGAAELVGQPEGSHAVFGAGSEPVVISVGSGFSAQGYTVVASESAAAEFWQRCIKQGAVPMGEQAHEQARICYGRPAADSELTEDYNPLEAGLQAAVSLTKGCFIGAETLSKLTNLDAVKQQLWGLQLLSSAAPGDLIMDGEEKCGKITSSTSLPNGHHVALGYIRCRSRGVQVDLAGKQVSVNGTAAELLQTPFALRLNFIPSKGSC